MKKIKLISIIIFLIIKSIIIAQPIHNIIYENKFHQNILPENLNTAFYLFDYIDSLSIHKASPVFQNNFGNSLLRLSKIFFTNYLVTDYMLTMNHEFGHGYRMIEAGGAIKKIVYNWPPPFSNNFSYITLDQPANFTKQQELMINLGGSEINLVFSDIMRKNILLEERFKYNYSFAYLYSSNDMPGYTAFVTRPEGDPARYRQNLNEFYYSDRKFLTRDKIKNYSYLSLFTDPMNFYALKSIFYDYVIKGENSSKVEMINLNSRLKYLPRFRFEYTPYGPELVYQNYFKFGSTLAQLSYSHSDPELPDSWRIAANVWNVKLMDNLSFNFSGQIWQQPEIEFYKNDKLINVDGLGGEFISTINYDMIKNKHLYGLTFQIGYKSSGYSIGEQLYEGMIIRGGISFQLNKDK
ncbi:hypothetical protein N9S34_02510 [bacterium]|nr:hypothetical protein [bacterium]